MWRSDHIRIHEGSKTFHLISWNKMLSCSAKYTCHCLALYCTVLNCISLHCTLYYCTVLYRTLLHSTVPYTTAQYWTVYHWPDHHSQLFQEASQNILLATVQWRDVTGEIVSSQASNLIQCWSVPTGPLKLKVASKNPWIGDYMQKKGLDEGFNLVYVATIFIGGNIN